MAASADERFVNLQSWAEQNGAALHPSVEVYQDPVTGYSFRVRSASSAVQTGDTVVTCPIPITLSYLNALPVPPASFHTDAEPFPEAFLERSPPYVIGRFFLIKQYLLGRKSFWWPYIQALPQPDRLSSWILPALWPTDDVELLEGTNVSVAIDEIKNNLKREYKRAFKLLEGAPNQNEYSRLLYNWAYCIFTSRSFRPSLVVSEPTKLVLPPGCAIDDFSMLLPLFDIGNHSITANVAWGSSVANSSCALTTRDNVQPGNQVFNNYGKKTNAELFLAYGFMLPETPSLHNDYVHFRKRATINDSSDSSPVGEKKDQIVSLRPMNDPSSVAGRVRQIAAFGNPKILSAFSHIQDSLIWDIVVAQTTPEQLATFVPIQEEAVDQDQIRRERLRHILSGDVNAGFRDVLEQTMAIIQNKVLQDLERLDESEFEVDPESLTKNQTLALDYRSRCRNVLMNVLESIDNLDSATE
jgi:protein-histidine N-methyltransferase